MEWFHLNLKNFQNRGGKEEHDYFFYFMKKNNIKFYKNLDYYVTKLINKFI